jgi:putative hemolysin
VVLAPVVTVLRPFDGLVRRLAGVPLQTAQSQAEDIEREILNVISEGEIHGAVDEEEKEMIESIIDLRDTDVEAIMTPRTDVAAAERRITLPELKALIAESGHSRIPVYDETIDTILGVLYAKDLLQLDADQPFDATKVMRTAIFVPETKLLRDLLHQFQEQKVHLAVVLDEYGGTAGLITIEDILEELVGEIVDEYEAEEPAPIRRIDETTVEVDARMRIEDLNDELRVTLPEDEDYETIGGFVFSTLGRIPTVGEGCEHDNIGIKVIAAEPRRITRLRLDITPLGTDNRNGS